MKVSITTCLHVDFSTDNKKAGHCARNDEVPKLKIMGVAYSIRHTTNPTKAMGPSYFINPVLYRPIKICTGAAQMRTYSLCSFNSDKAVVCNSSCLFTLE